MPPPNWSRPCSLHLEKARWQRQKPSAAVKDIKKQQTFIQMANYAWFVRSHVSWHKSGLQPCLTCPPAGSRQDPSIPLLHLPLNVAWCLTHSWHSVNFGDPQGHLWRPSRVSLPVSLDDRMWLSMYFMIRLHFKFCCFFFPTEIITKHLRSQVQSCCLQKLSHPIQRSIILSGQNPNNASP